MPTRSNTMIVKGSTVGFPGILYVTQESSLFKGGELYFQVFKLFCKYLPKGNTAIGDSGFCSPKILAYAKSEYGFRMIFTFSSNSQLKSNYFWFQPSACVFWQSFPCIPKCIKAKEFGETLAAQHRGVSFSNYSIVIWLLGLRGVLYILQIKIIMGILKNT